MRGKEQSEEQSVRYQDGFGVWKTRFYRKGGSQKRRGPLTSQISDIFDPSAAVAEAEQLIRKEGAVMVELLDGEKVVGICRRTTDGRPVWDRNPKKQETKDE